MAHDRTDEPRATSSVWSTHFLSKEKTINKRQNFIAKTSHERTNSDQNPELTNSGCHVIVFRDIKKTSFI
jgi:hypothetical protein